MSRPGPGRLTTSSSGRAERVAAMQRAAQARQRRTRILQWGTAAVVVLALATAATVVILREQRSRPTLDAVQAFTVSQGHVSGPVSYQANPPAGGEHNPVWLNCGAYDQPVPNENAVHAQEHGAVWVTYRPDLPADQVSALRAHLNDTYLLVSPFPDLPAPVVASAWGKQLLLKGADDPRLARFVQTYRLSPDAPESGAACTGGTNAPGRVGT